MKSIKSVLETEAIFSDDNQHRYLLKKTMKQLSQVTLYFII